MELGNVSFKLFTELSPPCRDPGKGLLTNETKNKLRQEAWRYIFPADSGMGIGPSPVKAHCRPRISVLHPTLPNFNST